MVIYPNLRLIETGDDASTSGLVAAKSAELLVVYDGERAFVERVLMAAGYTDLTDQVHFVVRKDKSPLDISRLARRLAITKLICFGQDLPSLGLHFQVAPYFPVTVADRLYLMAPSAAEIAAAKARGDNGPAGQLWRAVQQGFLFTDVQ